MKTRAMRRWAAVLLAVALVGGCGGGGGGDGDPDPDPDATQTSGRPPMDRSFAMMADVEVRGTGAAPFAWSGRHHVQVARVGGPGLGANLLSVAFMEPVATDDPQQRFRWAFDLLNAYADEADTFEMSAKPVNEQGVRNLAFLIWMRVTEDAKDKDVIQDQADVEFLKSFDEIRRPCTVEIGEDVLSGSLRCPELATEDGEVAGLEVVWSNGEKLPPAE